jgi:O-acetyl-ADP-ribose deacetylase (regulator of RNase III)
MKLAAIELARPALEDVAIDLWDIPADAICITTNGDINSQGRAVMGKGVAQQATQRWIGIDVALAKHLRRDGNVVGILKYPDGVDHRYLVSVPVKHHWNEVADVGLIASSLAELVELADRMSWQMVAVPRPGCGNGKLSWDGEVREVCEAILDSRFMVVHQEGE